MGACPIHSFSKPCQLPITEPTLAAGKTRKRVKTASLLCKKTVRHLERESTYLKPVSMYKLNAMLFELLINAKTSREENELPTLQDVQDIGFSS